jgi:hypothetical protein
MEDVHWKRFWVPRGDVVHLDWRGYLADPDEKSAWSSNPNATPTDALLAKPCLVFLGEPGIGKSSVIRPYRHEKAIASEHEELHFADLTNDASLSDDLRAWPKVRRWIEGETTLHLFLDSMDEHVAGPIEVGKWLGRILERGPVEQLRLRLTCRTAEWPQLLEKQLETHWPKGVGIYELAPLRRKDIEAAAGLDAKGFLEEVESREAVSLAIKPITLGFLLAEYQHNRALPARRAELCERGFRHLCEDSDTRNEKEQAGKLTADARLAVAARLAAVAILSRRARFLRGPSSATTLHDAVEERDLSGGSEIANGTIVDVDVDAVHEVIAMTGLFSAHGSNAFAFAHQTYAEFLAAWYLRNRGLSAGEMLHEVTSPGGRVIPALREVAAWLASMESGVFSSLLSTDPEALMRSDFAAADDVMREQLIHALLQAADRCEILDDYWWVSALDRLQHPRLRSQLEPYITDKTKYFTARRAAIHMARSCRLSELLPALAAVALDPTATPHIREQAAEAVYDIGDQGTRRQLRPLALGQAGPDPGHELQRHALPALWPDLLTTQELFSNLIRPDGEGTLIDDYWTFVSHRLGQSLSEPDFPIALVWTTTLPCRGSEASSLPFEELKNIVLRRGLGLVARPGILEPLAKAVHARWACREDVPESSHEDADGTKRIPRVDRRHLQMLSEAILQLPPHDHEAQTVAHFLLARDGAPADAAHTVHWLVERVRSTQDGSLRARWARILFTLYSWRMFTWDAEAAEAVVAVWTDVEEARAEFRPLWGEGSYDIDGPIATDARRQAHESRERHAEWAEREQRQPRRRSTIDEIKEIALLAEEGHIDAAIQLADLLRRADFERDQAAHAARWRRQKDVPPDWRTDAELRLPIIAIAERYITDNHDNSSWLGTDKISNVAWAAFHYLHLLASVEPARLEHLSAEIWRKWAPALLSWPGEKADLTKKLVNAAYRTDPSYVLEPLRQILEIQCTRNQETAALSVLADCWDDRIGRVVLDVARRGDAAPKFLGTTLDALIRRETQEAIRFSASLLAPSEGASSDSSGNQAEPLEWARMHAAAHALFVYAPKAAWPTLWSLFSRDAALGRDVLLTASNRINDISDWANQLSESDLAQFYLWLDGQFAPPASARITIGRVLAGMKPDACAHEFRTALRGHLASRGTAEAVRALEHLQAKIPSTDWTWALVRARRAAAQEGWQPRSVADILQLRPLRAAPASAPSERRPASRVSSARTEPVEIFIIYADDDRTFAEGLELALAPYVTSGIIRVWHAGKLVAGSDSIVETGAHMMSAGIIVPLVSPSFLGSSVETALLDRALGRRAAGSLEVAPVVIRPCAWDRTELSALPPLPADSRPVSLWESRDEAWLQVVRGLEEAAEKWRGR